MQLIRCFPPDINLALPESVKEALATHLLLPFASQAYAEQYWKDCPSLVCILDEHDTEDSLLLLSDVTQHQIEQALSNPEYTEALTAQYKINLSIISDDGAGLYLVIDKQSKLLNHI